MTLYAEAKKKETLSFENRFTVYFFIIVVPKINYHKTSNSYINKSWKNRKRALG